MAIFNQIPFKEFGTKWKHYGWFCGICPVYMDGAEEGMEVTCRNWVPEWCLELTEILFAGYVFFRSLIDPDYDPQYVFVISGEFLPPEKGN